MGDGDCAECIVAALDMLSVRGAGLVANDGDCGGGGGRQSPAAAAAARCDAVARYCE